MTISEKIKVVFHDIINVQFFIIFSHWSWQTDSEAIIIILFSCIAISAFIDKVFSMTMSDYSHWQAYTRFVNQKNWTMTMNILNHFCVLLFFVKNAI